mgnify:CR=1 FL=1
MKSRKNKLILNILTLCLCISAIAIGVYSAKNATLDISGSVAFSANYVKFKVESNVECASTTEADAIIKTFDTVTTECDSTNENGKAFSHDFGTLNFNDIIEGGNTVTVTLKITNQSEYRISVAMTSIPTFVDYDTTTASIPTDMQTTVTNGGKVVKKNKSINLAKSEITTYTISFVIPQDSLNNIETVSGKLNLGFKVTKYKEVVDAEGLIYSLNSSEDGLKVTGIGSCTEDIIKIPEKAYVTDSKGNKTGSTLLPVTEIADNAFCDKSVLIDFGMTEENASKAGYFWQDVSCSQIILPNTITNLGNTAFAGTNISINIPANITSINELAFLMCDIESISVDSNNSKYYDAGGSNVVIEKSNNRLVLGSNSATIIPDGVVEIGDNSFIYCTGPQSLLIPKSVTKIHEGQFRNCKNIESIVVDSGNTVYSSPNNCNAIIETATNTLLSGCQNTIIPSTVTKISASAFFGHTNLKQISLPKGVSIGEGAFSNTNCIFIGEDVDTNSNTVLSTDKKTVVIGNNKSDLSKLPATVETIGFKAFMSCAGLTSLNIAEGVKIIDANAFVDCYNITTIILPKTLTSIRSYAFVATFGTPSKLVSVSFNDTTNWKYNGTSIDVTNPTTNAENLKYGGSWSDNGITKG